MKYSRQEPVIFDFWAAVRFQWALEDWFKLEVVLMQNLKTEFMSMTRNLPEPTGRTITMYRYEPKAMIQ